MKEKITRGKSIGVRFSKEEIDLIKKKSNEIGLSVAAYVRMLILTEVKK